MMDQFLLGFAFGGTICAFISIIILHLRINKLERMVKMVQP